MNTDSHPYLADQRLRKDERLLRKAQFDAVFAAGFSVGNKRLVMRTMDNTLGHPRLGLVVGKRFGNAVQRNRWKRRIRDLFRRRKAALGGRDIVFMPAKGPEAQEADYDELKEAFEKLIARLTTN